MPVDTKMTPEAFLAQLDELVGRYGLDPKLPELIPYREGAARGELPPYPELWLMKLDPRQDTVMRDGRLYVQERTFGWALQPWTIAAQILGLRVVASISRIVVDRHGTHLYNSDGTELACFYAGVCDPRRLNDPGNRLHNAASYVNHYTGLELTGNDFRHQVSATFNRQGEDEAGHATWTAQFTGLPEA